MNMNPSKYLRAASSLFFCFCLFFGFGIAQASVLQKMVRSSSSIPQSKIEEVFDVLDDLGIKLKDRNQIREQVIWEDASIQFSGSLSENELRVLVHGLDDPMHLIRLSPSRLFKSDVYRTFFFSRFDLYRDSDALFTKLFSRENENKELPFQEAKRNWENFLDALRKAKQAGHIQIEKTDLEAAAISFVFQRFSGKYFPNVNASDTIMRPFSWSEQSLGMFFHNQFTMSHYLSSHFTLTPKDSYQNFIMTKIWAGSFSKKEDLFLINSKEFVLRIWSDVTEEISRQGSSGISSLVFLERIVDCIFELRRSPDFSLKDHHFLKAMEEAARENNHLARLFGIVKNFSVGTSSNLENYSQSILQNTREMSEPERVIIYDFISLILQNSREVSESDRLILDHFSSIISWHSGG